MPLPPLPFAALALVPSGADERSVTTVLIRTTEHVGLTLLGTALTLVLAVAIAVAVTRPGVRDRLAPWVIGVGNAGQALPALGVLGLLLATSTAEGRPGAGRLLVALVVATGIPVVRSTVLGLLGNETAVVDAARGTGMPPMRLATHVELPLALPAILASARTAVSLNAAAVALLFLFGGGGLGNTIAAGYADGQLSRGLLVVGSGLAILVAFGLDRLIAAAERRVARRPRR